MKRVFTLLVLCACVFLGACGSTSNNNTSSSNSNSPAPGGNGGSSGSGSGGGGSSSGSGSGSSGGTTGGGSSATAAIAYVAGSNNDFDGVRVDGSGNASSTSGSPYALGGPVQDMAISGGLLYVDWSVPNTGGYQLSAFKADGNGALISLSSMKVDGPTIGFDPSGASLYVGEGPGIAEYKVDRSSGALTPLPGSPFSNPAPGGMAFPVVSPNGSHLCARFNGPRAVEAIHCSVRHADGSLDSSGKTIPMSSQSGIGFPFLGITSDNTYVVASDGRQVEINPIASNDATAPKRVSSGGQNTMGIAISGPWVAVANHDSNTVSIFAVNSAGQMTLTETPVNTAGPPNRLAFSQNGIYLFVSSDAGMSAFQFDPTTGSLSPLNGGKSLPGSSRAVTAQ